LEIKGKRMTIQESIEQAKKLIKTVNGDGLWDQHLAFLPHVRFKLKRKFFDFFPTHTTTWAPDRIDLSHNWLDWKYEKRPGQWEPNVSGHGSVLLHELRHAIQRAGFPNKLYSTKYVFHHSFRFWLEQEAYRENLVFRIRLGQVKMHNLFNYIQVLCARNIDGHFLPKKYWQTCHDDLLVVANKEMKNDH